MALRYKTDILEKLRENGFTTYTMRKDKIIGERNIQQLRRGELVSWLVIDKLCALLKCNVGDLVEYYEDESDMNG